MDSDLLDMLSDVIRSYHDPENNEWIEEFWKDVKAAVGDDAHKSFFLGSVYGQCVFLYNTYSDGWDRARRQEYQELLVKLVKGMANNFNNQL